MEPARCKNPACSMNYTWGGFTTMKDFRMYCDLCGDGYCCFCWPSFVRAYELPYGSLNAREQEERDFGSTEPVIKRLCIPCSSYYGGIEP